MNRVVWLPALILLAIVATGCQSTKFPTPKWPDFAMFKKKDKDLAPPSEHFDVAEQTQLAGGSASDRKPMEIPGEAPAGAVQSPADLAKPTASMVAGKSGSPSSTGPTTKSGTAKSGTVPSSTQPIRKPYEIANAGVEGVKQAAGTLASDIEKSTQAATDQVSRNANEVVGQFQQQGRDLANAANNSFNQAANDVSQKANNALNSVSSAMQPANPASSGGSFAFSRPSGSTSGATTPPPWSSPASSPAAAQTSPPKPISPSEPATGPIDPLKSLAAGAALTPAPLASANPASSGFNPNPGAAAERQLQPINQQMVNQNLGAQAAAPASPAPSPQFQLPVAQPPAFVANRTSTPAGVGTPAAPFNSTPPSSASQFSQPASAPLTTAQPSAQSMSGGSATNAAPPAGSNKYPSTGFNSFVASGSNPPATPSAPLGNSAFNPPAASGSTPVAAASNVNAAWKNQASPIAASSNTSEAGATRPVSHSAEMPAELMQRSGGYAPGSIGSSSNGETLWR